MEQQRGMEIDKDKLRATLAFIREVEGLKSVYRTAWTATGQRESTAAHSWRLTLLAALLLPAYPKLDIGRVLRMCLIHDMGELYDGDVSAALHPDGEEKERREREGAGRAFSFLPAAAAAEYPRGESPESRLVKALDKAETILQHNQGANPPAFDYAFNLTYGAAYFQDDQLLEALREVLDTGTLARMNSSEIREKKKRGDTP